MFLVFIKNDDLNQSLESNVRPSWLMAERGSCDSTMVPSPEVNNLQLQNFNRVHPQPAPKDGNVEAVSRYAYLCIIAYLSTEKWPNYSVRVHYNERKKEGQFVPVS